jgi:hypothetical protein
MTQNIYDDPGFFAAYSQLGRSVAGLEGAAEWPMLQTLFLAPPSKKRERVLSEKWSCRP